MAWSNEDKAQAEAVKQFATDLGGGVVGTKAAHSLARQGIKSLDDLKAVLGAVGPEALHARLCRMKHFGPKCMNRVADVLEGVIPHTEEHVRTQAKDWNLPSFRYLPDGLEQRLLATLGGQIDQMDFCKTTPIDPLRPDGLTVRDLVALHTLLAGDP